MKFIDEIVSYFKSNEGKEICKDINSCSVSFSCTNESIKSIVGGMAINKTDSVLGILGSGDQGLAILGQGAKVTLVDYSEQQLDYFNKIYNVLVNPKNSNKLCREVLKNRFGSSKKNKKYLLRKLGVIRKNMNQIKILEKADMCNLNLGFSEFNKIYLSNIFDYRDCKNEKAVNKFIQFGEKFNPGTLFYSASQIMGKNINLTDLEKLFYLDSSLTKIAKSYEVTWDPEVIIRK